MTILILLVVMAAIWFALYERLKGHAYSMDVGGQAWTFFYFLDRYSSILRFVGYLTAAGMVAAVHSRNSVGTYVLLAALLDNVFLQALLLFWYETFVHATYMQLTAGSPKSPYTAAKYSLILTMAVGQAVFFGLGLLLTVWMY